MRIPSSRFLINRSIIKKNTCSVPTRAFNLGTRAFSLLTRGFELVIRGFELVTRVLLFHLYILLKLNDKSITILLTNDLANICSEISKIRLILWMVYTCSVKELEEVEKLGGRNECTLYC